ncbi:DNA ligase-1 [Paenibacillus sp. GP183]|nr:DNA ligase-1 [Paenibacillus sp. GP183]
MHSEGPRVKLFTRHQNDCTSHFPEFTAVHINATSAILDGEMIAFGADGKPDFELVMSQFQSSRLKNLQSVHFAAFDVLMINGKSVMHLPLERRLELLHGLVSGSDQLSVVQPHDDGEALYESVKAAGLEGIVSKRRNSRYVQDHRSRDWIKLKNYQFEEVAISGIRKNEFGWALQFDDGRYAVICEFAPPEARAVFRQISKLLVQSENQNWLFLDPLIRCRVKYQCLTHSGLLRSPSFVEFILAS